MYHKRCKKQYKPQSKSVNSGQVLQCAYDNTRAEIIVREMAENLSYELMKKEAYDKENCPYGWI